MHTDAKRFYRILKVEPAASDEAIRVAFRLRAKQLHPDSPTGDASAFIRLKRAYDVLSDSSQRTAYDRNCQPAPPVAPHRFNVPPLPSRPMPMPPVSRRRGRSNWVRYAIAFIVMAAISLGGVQAMIIFTEAPPSIRTRATPHQAETTLEAAPTVEAPAAPGSSKTGFWDPTPPARNSAVNAPK